MFFDAVLEVLSLTLFQEAQNEEQTNNDYSISLSFGGGGGGGGRGGYGPIPYQGGGGGYGPIPYQQHHTTITTTTIPPQPSQQQCQCPSLNVITLKGIYSLKRVSKLFKGQIV